MRIGTPNFISQAAAVKYYGSRTRQKLKEREIHIGKPKTKEGDRLLINDEGRYVIETTTNPRP